MLAIAFSVSHAVLVRNRLSAHRQVRTGVRDAAAASSAAERAASEASAFAQRADADQQQEVRTHARTKPYSRVDLRGMDLVGLDM